MPFSCQSIRVTRHYFPYMFSQEVLEGHGMFEIKAGNDTKPGGNGMAYLTAMAATAFLLFLLSH